MKTEFVIMVRNEESLKELNSTPKPTCIKPLKLKVGENKMFLSEEQIKAFTELKIQSKKQTKIN